MSLVALHPAALTLFRRRLLLSVVPILIPAGVPDGPTAVLINGALTLNNSWDGGWYLGEGGNALTGLWIQHDANQMVAARIAVKDIAMQPPFWTSQNLWSNNAVGTVLKEAELQRLLNSKVPNPAQSRLAKIYGHYIVMPQQGALHAYRVFMEYCPRGNLLELVQNHHGGGDPDHLNPPGRATRNVRANTRQQTNQVVPRPRRIPEAFLWHLFEQLVLTCIELQHHPRPHPSQHQNGLCVHGDIKLENIMLVDPDPNNFPEYPQVKLIDFGMARMTWPNEPGNPANFSNYAPTHGWAPVELWRGPHSNRPNTAHPPGAQPYRVGAKANTWGMAMVVRACMSLDPRPDQIDYHNEPQMNWVPDMGGGRIRAYSADLRSLVKRCLHFDPAQRPSDQVLLTQIRHLRRRHLQGMDAFRRPAAGDSAKERKMRACAERDVFFPIGSHVYRQPQTVPPVYPIAKG